MRGLRAVASISVLATCCIAKIHFKRADNPAVVQLPMIRGISSHSFEPDISPPVESNNFYYYTNITLGTPAQSFVMHIDTGSSDFWVYSDTANICRFERVCDDFGAYDARASTTSTNDSNTLSVNYGDNTFVRGEFVNDDLQLGAVNLNAVRMGVGYSTNVRLGGVWGVGYTLNQANAMKTTEAVYPTALDHMIHDGVIKSRAYSMHLNDINSGAGSILFGGVDTSLFSGSLTTVPIVPTSNGYRVLWVTLSNVSHTTGGSTTQLSTTNLSSPFILDSGTSVLSLPQELNDDIYKAAGATFDTTTQNGIIPCSLQSSTDGIEFNFTGKAIMLPWSQLVRAPLPGGLPDGTCWFDVAVAPKGGLFILGDPFLRAAYVVYDLDNNQIGLAQAVYNAQSSSIMEIMNGTNGIPEAANVTETTGASSSAPTGSEASALRIGTGIMGVAVAVTMMII